jgi:hypothetical protein
MLRRLRGILGTALTWSAGWTAVGLTTGAVKVLMLRAAGLALPMESWRFVLIGTVRWTVFGAVAGILFSLGVMIATRRLRSLSSLSPRRAAWWGLGAGIVFPLVVVGGYAAVSGAPLLIRLLPLVVTSGVFGAGTAAGMLVLARRVPDSLPEHVDTPPPLLPLT